MLRAYDNRVRETSRSPFVYKEWKEIKDDVRVVLDIKDGVKSGDEIIEFRDPTFYNQSNLFRADGFGGKVEVIAVPFIPGRHRCSHVTQAISIVECLESLHQDGFVHGDIRACNMVFGDKSKLIDYDFGGKYAGVDAVTYPPGYKQDLRDGSRNGRERSKISKDDEVNALGYVLGVLHKAKGQRNYTFYDIKEATSLADMKLHLNDLKTQGVAIDLAKGFQTFLEAATKKEDAIDKTDDGAACTPDKTIVVREKRSLESSEASVNDGQCLFTSSKSPMLMRTSAGVLLFAKIHGPVVI